MEPIFWRDFLHNGLSESWPEGMKRRQTVDPHKKHQAASYLKLASRPYLVWIKRYHLTHSDILRNLFADVSGSALLDVVA